MFKGISNTASLKLNTGTPHSNRLLQSVTPQMGSLPTTQVQCHVPSPSVAFRFYLLRAHLCVPVSGVFMLPMASLFSSLGFSRDRTFICLVLGCLSSFQNSLWGRCRGPVHSQSCKRQEGRAARLPAGFKDKRRHPGLADHLPGPGAPASSIDEASPPPTLKVRSFQFAGASGLESWVSTWDHQTGRVKPVSLRDVRVRGSHHTPPFIPRP